MLIALKPFLNNHTRQLVAPGDVVTGYSETAIEDLTRNGLVSRNGATVTVAATPRTADVLGEIRPVADSAGDAGASVPATSVGRTVTTKRTLRSAIGGE